MSQYIIFSHGFGFDRHFWVNLSKKFNSYKIIIIDYGYFNDGGIFIFMDNSFLHINDDIFNEIIKNTSNVYGIGHSLGFAKLFIDDRFSRIKFKKIISLAGFEKFNNSDKISENLNTMINMANKNKNFLPSFYKMCSVTQKCPENINYNLLINDLELLKNIDISNKINRNDILYLVDRYDKILDNQNVIDDKKFTYINDCGHGIGFNNSQLCHDIIMSFIYE